MSSCSETNWPKLATKRVEHGGVPLLVDEADPGLAAMAGLAATKCAGGNWACIACIATAAAWLIGWGTVNGGYNGVRKVVVAVEVEEEEKKQERKRKTSWLWLVAVSLMRIGPCFGHRKVGGGKKREDIWWMTGGWWRWQLMKEIVAKGSTEKRK